MSNPRIAPYGNWISSITAEAVAAQSLSAGVEDIFLDPVTSKVYLAQKRPAENGRSAVIDAEDRQDLFDGSWDARTQVHEYGGAAAIIFGDTLYFSHILDHRVYKTVKGGSPTAITPVSPAQRFADFTVHPKHPHLVICLVEDHSDPHPAKVETYLVLINASTSTVTKIVHDADFYACPRFSPDGNFLVWQQWHHPEMPFQSSEIIVAHVVSDGQTLELGTPAHVAGKTEAISAQDPIWNSNNSIIFLSDESGFHNPWKFTFDPAKPLKDGQASPICPQPIKEEFGAPQWWLSRHGSGALSETHVAFTSFRKGRTTLYICDVSKGNLLEVPTPYAHIQYLHGDGKGKVVMLGQPADSGEVLVELTIDEMGKPLLTSLSPPSASVDSLPSSYISPGEYHELILPPDGRTCHVTYYAPKNPHYGGGLPGEKPPVVVLIHGGPFYMEPANLDWSKQFFTSRGWAYIDVNYGGSTGFGRAFRESLHNKWGVLDVQDAYQSVLRLGSLGLVDAKRAVVHGGSAGGYSVLQIATTLPDAFAAGAPHYGVSDMRKLDEILHKFEYHLCDRLMGGKWEECESVWRERSPIYHVDKIKMPLLFLQGGKDTVVPADQMINMVETIKARGGKAELILFPDEGHGWRQASSVQTTLEKELTFFNEVLGFKNNY
ncbi:alpha/beta-hydrolase [Sistotremastrum suecicum HHB10207 ss-3]|uniref:Alpha/beta-hydrolase n=1 Tax=Sistotremastrum suecicum HHB10207 ss-3 TaxID=1314776 RepID=A0A166ISR8_9AGAM|nr:alpha/beta-hydrolase [Sistotremastrum suecicum HHB10207 ss-3]